MPPFHGQKQRLVVVVLHQRLRAEAAGLGERGGGVSSLRLAVGFVRRAVRPLCFAHSLAGRAVRPLCFAHSLAGRLVGHAGGLVGRPRACSASLRCTTAIAPTTIATTARSDVTVARTRRRLARRR